MADRTGARPAAVGSVTVGSVVVGGEVAGPDGERPATKLRLFGFHHAGGAPAAFTGWQRALGPAVEVVPVTLPGRGARGWSRRHEDLPALAEAVARELGPRLAAPHVFYGHSMGALVAHRLALLRAARGLRLPERLLVGAAAAPHLGRGTARAHGLADAELADWLVGLSARPGAVAAHFEDTDRLPGVLALLREDLRLCTTAGPGGPARPVPLPCPIDVFAGERDPLVPVRDAARWSSYSSSEDCTLRVIAGGHFFPRESREPFFRALRSALPDLRSTAESEQLHGH
ncbi:thioesterase II family protein [Kitasatospora sp. NPDC057015]|uniref:thioesterase II family protein n=1 Tax=Kitasatospora sp. NPDC057015 TaxID=3346001 RepID=UPI00362E4F29